MDDIEPNNRYFQNKIRQIMKEMVIQFEDVVTMQIPPPHVALPTLDIQIEGSRIVFQELQTELLTSNYHEGLLSLSAFWMMRIERLECLLHPQSVMKIKS
jgi:hypothetical protein